MKQIDNLLSTLISNFGFDSWSDFTSSLMHTKLLAITIPFAMLAGAIEQLLGLKPITVMAFILLLALELLTGVVASKVKKVPITSRRFSRFGVKLLGWLILMLVSNTFSTQYKDNNVILYQAFSWLNAVTILFVTSEYFISVVENLGKIRGKNYKKFTDAITDKAAKLLNTDEDNKDTKDTTNEDSETETTNSDEPQ